MLALSAFPITKKWPAQNPDRIQLYSLPTPNGVKVSGMLEETGLPYEPHLVSFDTNDQASPEFRSLNPYGKIPAIIDPNGPGGKPLPLFESVGDAYTIADIATFPWVRNLIDYYGAGDLVGIEDFPHVTRALDSFVARPAIARGINIPKRA